MFEINILAVLATTVLDMVLGAVWYSALFKSIWIKLRPPQKMASQKKAYIGSTLCSLVSSLVMAVFMNLIGSHSATGGLLVGLAAGVGFAATEIAKIYLFDTISFKLYLINAGYAIVGLTLTGMVLGVWR